MSSHPFDRLQSAVAPSALHNSGERFQPPKCHPNTRVAILDLLMDWIFGNFEAESIFMWLYGPAGAGKSAIAQTLAEWCFARGLLLAAFIFSRTDSRRNHIGPLAATLSYQIALIHQNLRSFIEEAVQANPLIFFQSLETQLLTLVVHPLLKFIDNTSNMPPIPPLVVVDGLDECLDPGAQSHFVNVVSDLLHEYHLPIKLLIASRPEPHLVTEFNSDTMLDILARLALDDSWRPDVDIRLFLRATFQKIKKTHPLRASIPHSWPSADKLGELIRRSSGQFVYANTVANFFSSIRHQPMQRLDVVLGIHPAKDTDMPFAQLDALYRHIFESVTDTEMALKIMGVLIASGRLNDVSPLALGATRKVEVIASLLFYDVDDIRLCLGELASVLNYSESRDIAILHASLTDFFMDPSRSRQLHISQGVSYTYACRMCIRHIVRDAVEFATKYSYNCLLDFYPLSEQSPELVEDIRSLDFARVHKSWIFTCNPGGSNRRRSWIFLSKLIAAVKLAGPLELYFHMRDAMDHLIIQTLAEYDSVNDILALTTLLGFTTEKPNSGYSPFLSNVFGIGENTRAFDTQAGKGLKLLSEGTDVNKYSTFLLEFFSDPSRSGQYALNGSRYESAVVKCLKFLLLPRPPDLRDFVLNREPRLWLKWIPPFLRKSPRSRRITSLSYDRNLHLILRGLSSIDFHVIMSSLKEYLERVDPDNASRLEINKDMKEGLFSKFRQS